MAATPRAEAKNTIQVIERMIRLLDVLSQHPEPLGLKQIAQYTGLHPSTAHRILSSMSADRIVDRVEPGSYRLGMRLLELGNLVKSRISVRELALPLMRELHSQTGETANLSVRHDDEIVYVERTGLAMHTKNTITSLPLLERDLERTQRQGWATDNEEAEIGVRCVAA